MSSKIEIYYNLIAAYEDGPKQIEAELESHMTPMHSPEHIGELYDIFIALQADNIEKRKVYELINSAAGLIFMFQQSLLNQDLN